MTEAEARRWLSDRFGASTLDGLEDYVALLLEESEHQNLIAATTVPDIWARHIVDSAQLLTLAPKGWETWIDIGAGAGLPGVVVAILSGRSVTLVEPRRLRVAFLERCIANLGLVRVRVVASKAERFETAPLDVVSARAVAKLNTLLTISRGFSDARTAFLLPKGETARSDVAVAQKSWHGTFHVEHSVVDPTSGIVIATGISPR